MIQLSAHVEQGPSAQLDGDDVQRIVRLSTPSTIGPVKVHQGKLRREELNMVWFISLVDDPASDYAVKSIDYVRI